MADTEIFDMPMELGLELMTVISADFSYPEWELVDDVIDEADRVSLGMLLVDFECTNTRSVINSSILEAAYLLALLSEESQKLDVHLDMMTRDLFVVALGVNFTHPCSARQPVQAIAFEYPVDGCVG